METLNTTIGMINHQKWCHKCGGFVEGIFAGNPRSCRCDPKADHIKELEAEVERLKDRLNDCLSFVALHGRVGATQDTAKLLEARILATLKPTDK